MIRDNRGSVIFISVNSYPRNFFIISFARDGSLLLIMLPTSNNQRDGRIISHFPSSHRDKIESAFPLWASSSFKPTSRARRHQAQWFSQSSTAFALSLILPLSLWQKQAVCEKRFPGVLL